MNLLKITISFLFVLCSFTIFGQVKYDPIQNQIDQINPVYAIINRTTPNGVFQEKILKKDTARIQQILTDETLESTGYELVNIDQMITYWTKKEGKDVHCCFGPDDCYVWVLLEKKLVYTDSIHLFEKPDLVVVDIDVDVDVEIFPNPVVDFLNIKGNTKILSVKIFDFLGVEMRQKRVDNNNLRINLNNLSRGNYIIQLAFKNKTISRKLVKL